MTHLDTFLRDRPREGGEDEGNGEGAGEETEEQERFAKEYYRATSLLERVTLAEDGTMDAVTLTSASFSLDGCQEY